MNKSITIVAPAYNHERYVEQCLTSIAKQKCEKMELIILDDCSKDSTVSIIDNIVSRKEFTDAFSLGVQFIRHKKNCGAHDTINEGLTKAKGSFLAVINTDDYFGDDHLRPLLEKCESDNSEFAFGGIKVVDENNCAVEKGYGKAIMKYQDTLKMCPTSTMALSRGNSTISTGNMVFSSRLYKDLNGFRNYKYVHDWDFALRAALITEPVFVEEAYYYYRLHGGNTISEISGHPEDANKMENAEQTQVTNPLIDFFIRILKKDYKNEKIPSKDVWEYFFKYKKYYDDDYDAAWAWEIAKGMV